MDSISKARLYCVHEPCFKYIMFIMVLNESFCSFGRSVTSSMEPEMNMQIELLPEKNGLFKIIVVYEDGSREKMGGLTEEQAETMIERLRFLEEME